ncbi:PIR Superfamily Protein [Plasmodium ovale wallikeri]|uniref:Plasmodium vivax Vir protein, putative n=2 Tax=Plasmodium ovale TaxID=36330 RepID=A0A1C3KH26_PLAOA|nr:PIR Superfamily Protein [Plasmodium ovale wallikeri]SBT73051.1 Plasmodium vivax Vir protein, putative [Plasmodium ovale]
MEEWEKILNNSSKYELYNKFNEKCDHKCNYVSYCSEVDYLEKWYTGFLDVCYMFARNLINLNEILSGENNEKRCIYMNFWITDYVRKMLENKWKNNTYISYILPSFLTVENIITGASKKYNCHFDYSSNIDLNLWKERKDLHDYIENYSYIKEKIESDMHLCKIYSEYFVYIKGLHEKYKRECCNGLSDKCPNQLNLDYFCNNEILINKLECNENKVVLTASPKEVKYQVLEEHGASGRYNSAPASLHDRNQEVTGDILTNNSGYYAKLGTSISFLGIASTIFYLYKFTTFGNLIRSKVLKTKIKVNIDEDAQNLMTHELNNEDKSFYSNDYKIAYNP